MTTPAAPARARRFPIWAVALIVVVLLAMAGVTWAVLTGLGAASAERQVAEACRTAVRTALGTGTSDVDLEKYPPLVTRAAGSNRSGTFHVAGEVDFTRSGAPERGYYDCEVRRSGGDATVTGVTGL